MPKFGNFEKSGRISETAAHGVKINLILPTWDRKRVYVQHREPWPMAFQVDSQAEQGPWASC